jgi:hypothetical protein
MSTQPLKTVFLDYDTVANGDLDLANLPARCYPVRRA